jgi:RNA polymerase sigma-70 factor (ECF subfamily)
MREGMNQLESLYDVPTFQQRAIGSQQTSFVALADESSLLEQLRRGSEAAFASLIDRYTPAMLHLAMMYVRTWAVAEEVVQETWMAVLEGLHRFEGRSSLKTWIFRILTNCAITRAQRESRSVAFSSLSDYTPDLAEDMIDSDRFSSSDHLLAAHQLPCCKARFWFRHRCGLSPCANLSQL